MHSQKKLKRNSSKKKRESKTPTEPNVSPSTSTSNLQNSSDTSELLKLLQGLDNGLVLKPETWELISKQIKSDGIDWFREVEDSSCNLFEAFSAKIQMSLKKIKFEAAQIESEKSKLREKRRKFEQEKQNVLKKQSKRVKLNVGGKIFYTSVSTLTKYPASMLGAMFSGRHNVEQEEDGSFFIDRDGTHFGLILNYLRDGSIDMPTVPRALQSLKREALFYGLTSFVKQIQDFNLVNDLLFQRKTKTSAERRALIVDSMKAYPLNSTLQLQGLKEIQKLAINEVSEKDIVVVEETNGTSWIMDLMEKYKYTSKELIIECVKTLSILSQNVENCNTIAEESGIELIFDAMESYPNDIVIQTHSCGVLWSLTYKDEMCDTVVDQRKDLGLILDAMDKYSQSLELQVNACATLWNLAYIEPKIVITLKEKGLELILNSMRNYPTNLTLQRKAIGVLENLDAKDKTYVKIAKKSGIGLILAAMERYPNNPDLQTGACGTLCNLAANTDIKKELKAVRCQQLICYAASRFKVKEADELLDLLEK